MMGTGPFAVPTFKALVESSHDVCGLVTRPPAGSHRRKRKDINPMREAAEGLGLEIHDPASVNDPEFAPVLKGYAADLFVVCDYGQILSREVLGYSSLGGINLHGSLLPKYRGAAPINWAIFNGDPTTGNTVILMTPKLDGGPILAKTELQVLPEDTAVTVEEKLSAMGPAAVLECIERLESWDGHEEIGELQDKTLATKAPRLSKQDGQVDWSRSAREIFNQVRAFQPWPGSFSNLVRQASDDASSKNEVRLIFTLVEQVDVDDSSPAGTLIQVDSKRMVVQTGQGGLEILQVQPAGKKPMPVADFMRGNPVSVGDRFE